MAILLAVDQWHSYLISGEFIIRTDQGSLIHLDDQRLTTLWQQKAHTKLLGLQFCCYKKGSTNRVADALSRLPTEQVMALSVLRPLWFQEVSDSYSRYPDTTPLIQALALKSPLVITVSMMTSLSIRITSFYLKPWLSLRRFLTHCILHLWGSFRFFGDLPEN